MNQTGRAGEISLRGVTKRFGATAAVDNLDLDVTPGEFLALLGPSGCGKTTTLRLIAGFEQADAGEIRIAGNRVENVPPHKRPVNTVFQQYALFPHMSVLDNVAYGLRQRGVGKTERRRRAEDALDLVHMSAKRDQRPTELSGGQQQRVALARALVLQPEVLLLDEPLAALDKKLRTAMQLELKRIQREVSITFIVVTHDQQEAMALADRIAVMAEGRIEQLGSPQEVYDRPSTPFVAGFVGDMNRVPARLNCANAMANVAGVEMPVGRIMPDVTLPDGALVHIGIRPDDVQLNGDRGVPGTVESTLSLGHYKQLLVRLNDGTELLAHRPRAEVGEITDGMAVTVNWPREAALVLDYNKGDQ